MKDDGVIWLLLLAVVFLLASIEQHLETIIDLLKMLP